MHGRQAGSAVRPVVAVRRKNDRLWCNCACGGRTSMGQLASRGGGSMASDNGTLHALWQFEQGRLVLRSCTCEAGRPRGRLQQSRCRVSLERVTLGRRSVTLDFSIAMLGSGRPGAKLARVGLSICCVMCVWDPLAEPDVKQASLGADRARLCASAWLGACDCRRSGSPDLAGMGPT